MEENTYCLCGCGRKADKGKRFAKGHAKFLKENTSPPFCACGCNKTTEWDKYKNQYNRFIIGHIAKTVFIKGRKFTEEHKRNIGLGQIGKIVSEETKKKLSERNKGNTGENNPFYGRKHTNETKIKFSEIAKKRVGPKSSNWKGGIHRLSQQIRNSEEYQNWRLKIFERDNFHCTNCGKSSNGDLNAHHIKPFQQILPEYKIKTMADALNCQDLWNIENGITFCKQCHIKAHSTKEA